MTAMTTKSTTVTTTPATIAAVAEVELVEVPAVAAVPEVAEVESVDLGRHSGSLTVSMMTVQELSIVRNTLCTGNVTPLAVHSSMNAASSGAMVVSVPCSVPLYVTALLLKHPENPSLLISLAENPHWHNPSTADITSLTIVFRVVSALSDCVIKMNYSNIIHIERVGHSQSNPSSSVSQLAGAEREVLQRTQACHWQYYLYNYITAWQLLSGSNVSIVVPVLKGPVPSLLTAATLKV